MTKNSALYASILLAASLVSGSAQAQLLNNLTNGSPKALALGNAVTADPPGIDSIHFNPAGLAKIKGRQYNVKFLVAQVEMSSQIGAPIKPNDETKQTFYDLVQDTQCAFTTDIDTCWGIDPTANRSDSTTDASIMLPFAGMTSVPILAVPSAGVAVEDPDMGWTYGTAAFVHHGLGYERDYDSPAAYQGVEVGVTRLTYFSPTVAIPINEKLAMGIGINLSYQGFYIDSRIRAPLESTRFLSQLEDLPQNVLDALGNLSVLRPYDDVGRLNLDMEDYRSFGLNFGILWHPKPWLSFGLNYQSEARAHLRGDYQMVNSDEFLATTRSLSDSGLDQALLLLDGAPFNAKQVETGTVTMDYIVPQTLSLGTSIQLTPAFKFNLDLKWAEFSAWNSLDFKFSNNVDYLNFSSVLNYIRENQVGDNADPDEMRLRRKYDDVWSYAIGGEYQWSDQLVLRAGYEPRTSAIPGGSSDLFFPLGDMDLYTIGFGYQVSSLTRIDAAFAYAHTETDTAACESRNANSCIEGDVLYNPYYSQPFKTEVDAYFFTFSFDRKF